MKSKASFLLVIFLLNTIAGLCCTLHVFHNAHDGSTAHHHLSPGITHQRQSVLIPFTSVSKADTCCQSAVNKFTFLAKLVPQTSKAAIQLPVALATFYHLYAFAALPDFRLKTQHFGIKRQRPPTSDTRIVIQSFQI